MSKKTLATLGMIVSMILVLFAALVFTGELGGDANYPSTAPYGYDSGYATFGGDFYTYASNNAAEAASASRTAAANIRELCNLMKNVCGCFLMGFGLMGFCHFGIIRCDCKEKETLETTSNKQEVSIEAPVETTVETAVEVVEQ